MAPVSLEFSHGHGRRLVWSCLVNIFDTLEITYTSSWDALNLTLFCLANDVPSDYQVWQVPNNPIAASGTYRLESIYSVDFTIYKFPTSCSFKLTQYGDNDIARGGENFQLVSIPGTSTTYRSTVTATTLPAPTSPTTSTAASSSTNSLASQTAAFSHSSSVSVTTPPLASSASGQTPTATSSASPTPASEPVVQQAGLSTGVKAGIGIGVGVILLVMGALCFMVYKLRRKINKPVQADPQEDVRKLQPELPVYTALQDYKPAYVYNSHELEQTSQVELPVQETKIAISELQGSK